MNFLKAIGLAFLTALITGIGLLAGLVISVLSTIVGTVVTIALAVIGVYTILATAHSDHDDKPPRDD